MAYAETQSMFCDSLLNDADWLKRYARNADGQTIPDALIRDRVVGSQPMRAFDERSHRGGAVFRSGALSN